MIPNIDSLYNEKNVKNNSKIEIFKVVLAKCVEKIMYTNRSTDKTFVIFEVPKIMIGYPSYDMNVCSVYLMNKLMKKNYKVSFIEPFYLYIDWGMLCKKGKEYEKLEELIQPKQYNNGKLKDETVKLLKKFPNTSNVEFVYEDNLKKKNKK